MKQTDIDMTLTRDNALERGYKYGGDILYDSDPSKEYGEKQFVEEVLRKGGKLGKPRNETEAKLYTHNTLYGVYLSPEYLQEHPQDDEEVLKRIEIDTSLTPQNSEEKGYYWLDDGVFFDKTLGVDANREAIDYVRDGFKLGMPSKSDKASIEEYGLYVPIKE